MGSCATRRDSIRRPLSKPNRAGTSAAPFRYDTGSRLSPGLEKGTGPQRLGRRARRSRLRAGLRRPHRVAPAWLRPGSTVNAQVADLIGLCCLKRRQRQHPGHWRNDALPFPKTAGISPRGPQRGRPALIRSPVAEREPPRAGGSGWRLHSRTTCTESRRRRETPQPSR